MKTEADMEEISKLSFLGGLYLNKDKQVIIPSHLVEATLVCAARKTKLGKQATGAISIMNDAVLKYDGPTDLEELFADDDHRFTNMVVVQRNRVTRTRPMFKNWEASFELQYDEAILDEAQIKEILVTAGNQIGFGDWRPRFGLFNVEV